MFQICDNVTVLLQSPDLVGTMLSINGRIAMLATFVFAPLLMAQAVTTDIVEQQVETRDVAYEEMVAGEFGAAIALLEDALEDHPGDPAILINLGSAHSALGNWDTAQTYYRAARLSDEHYEMELADGRWLDSRDVAAMAMGAVEVRSLASR